MGGEIWAAANSVVAAAAPACGQRGPIRGPLANSRGPWSVATGFDGLVTRPARWIDRLARPSTLGRSGRPPRHTVKPLALRGERSAWSARSADHRAVVGRAGGHARCAAKPSTWRCCAPDPTSCEAWPAAGSRPWAGACGTGPTRHSRRWAGGCAGCWAGGGLGRGLGCGLGDRRRWSRPAVSGAQARGPVWRARLPPGAIPHARCQVPGGTRLSPARRAAVPPIRPAGFTAPSAGADAARPRPAGALSRPCVADPPSVPAAGRARPSAARRPWRPAPAGPRAATRSCGWRA